ncbi:hypothetical protein BJP36_12280 [Moorena producens JHB]|uniref:Uncharacterized protein n=1 Tax=Moorena producens (strain JHB) TaxID=1454205 RepID=A0A1D9FYX3_MOOP1|nr:hypothetical protein [Moorena producens]AOY80582.2 hypothetical protein BJP36_12280 [Moorena producens JHB]
MRDLPEGGKEVFFDPEHIGFQTVEAILDGFSPPVAIAVGSREYDRNPQQSGFKTPPFLYLQQHYAI